MTPEERAELRRLAEVALASSDETSESWPLTVLALTDALDATEAKVARLREALNDIAEGNIPALPPLEDKHEFRYQMWQWSQARARKALAETEPVDEG